MELYATQWQNIMEPWGWETLGLYTQPRAAREHRDALIMDARGDLAAPGNYRAVAVRVDDVFDRSTFRGAREYPASAASPLYELVRLLP